MVVVEGVAYRVGANKSAGLSISQIQSGCAEFGRFPKRIWREIIVGSAGMSYCRSIFNFENGQWESI